MCRGKYNNSSSKLDYVLHSPIETPPHPLERYMDVKWTLKNLFCLFDANQLISLHLNSKWKSMADLVLTVFHRIPNLLRHQCD